MLMAEEILYGLLRLIRNLKYKRLPRRLNADRADQIEAAFNLMHHAFRMFMTRRQQRARTI